MYAVIQTGGKQYRVEEGDFINVEKLTAEVGATISIPEVLLVGKQNETLVGKPYVAGATVKAEVVETGRAKKVIIYKYKAKKDYRKKMGHRQPYTKLKIKTIAVKKASKDKDAPQAAEA